MHLSILNFFCISLRRGMFRLFLIAISLAVSHAVHAAEERYPARPVKVVLMFPAGGGADGQMRMIAERLRNELHQPVIIDNRPGGAGIIAANTVKSAPADGYTVLHAGAALMLLTPRLNSAATYSMKDFVPVASIATSPPVLFARTDFPANNLKELVALAKSRPNEITYGTWGSGSIPDVAGALLQKKLGLSWRGVPYKGEVPVIQDMLGSQLSLGWATLPVLMPYLKTGKFKVLGVASAAREKILPNAPTFVEQGVSDYVISGWTGLFVSKDTPPQIVERLSKAINKVIADSSVQQQMATMGQAPFVSSPEDFSKYIKKESDLLEPILGQVASTIGK